MKNALMKIRLKDAALASKIEKQGGFILAEDVTKLEQIDRLMSVLVRCGNGRFLCAVQDVNHFMTIINEHSQMMAEKHNKPAVLCPNTDHVRDVSLPAE